MALCELMGEFTTLFCYSSVCYAAVVVFPTSRIHSSGYFYFVNFTCRENYCLSLQNWTPADQIDTLLRPQKSWYCTVPSHSGIILSEIVQYRNIKMFALNQRVFNLFSNGNLTAGVFKKCRI